MDTADKLKDWLRKMGYDGKIPPNLQPICNAHTGLLWEQIIHTVKPRQEVEHIRNNILINRLLKNDETCSNSTIYSLKHESRYPLKEIEIWNKKQKLQQQIGMLQERINEAELKINNLSTQNKMKYMKLENIRQKIDVNHKCAFLLNKKSKHLEDNTVEVEEMLMLACNLTPVESEDQNKTEVLETLQKCSEKLEKIIDKQNEVPSVLNMNSFEVQTPRHKTKGGRSFLSVRKPRGFMSSTKITYQNVKKSKQGLNDSLGLLDDLSVTFDNALAASSFKELNLTNAGMCYDLHILNDQVFNELLQNLLYTNDRLVIWNALAEINDGCKKRLIGAIIEGDQKTSSATSLERKDEVLTKLYAMHVDYELKIVKNKLQIQELTRTARTLQEAFFSELANKNLAPSALSNLRNHLELQRKEAGLAAAIQYIHKHINSIQNSTKNQEDLQIIKERSLQLEENIVAKLSCIEHKFNIFKQINEAMSQTRSETSMLVRKLGQFTIDSTWTSPLNNNISSMEIETFLDFPLEYNRISFGNPKVFVRDLPINHIPYQDELDSNMLLILITLLQSPWSPAETLLLDIVRARNKLETLKALKYVPDDLNINTHNLEELRTQESYVTYALDKLKSLIHAESTNRTTHVLTQIRETVGLWLEMPIRNFISSKRLFNGAPYQHYEKLFDEFYKQL